MSPSVCQDNEAEPWGYSVARSYQRIDSLAQRDEGYDRSGAAYQSSMQAKQPRMDAIVARIQELSVQVGDAAGKGDYDRVDAINLEIDKASAEMEAVMSEGGTLDQLDAANEEGSRDTDIRLGVAINSGCEEVGHESRTVTAAGAERAYRWSTSGGNVGDETALILFGQWQEAGNGIGIVPRAGAAPTAVQGLAVRVTADEGRIESILDGIDFLALAKLVAP